MTFRSYSQCHQDSFAHYLIGDNGTFLDIGASHPTELSNTYGLEQVGWTGVCVEIEHDLCELLRKQRTARVIEGDATKVNWLEIMPPIPLCDYCSLDIDERTLEVLERLITDYPKFRVMTVEHDQYRHGEKLRGPQRDILTAAGYVLAVADVCTTPGMPMEDFWVIPELAEKAKGFRL